MSLLIDDNDIRKIKEATSQVVKDAIGEAANVLVPAIGAAASNVLGNMKVEITIGPIPAIEITVKVSPT